ncbi:GNAT family N-acetyltransferase [Taibaiella helva]|uniref:GNAT family N-acetyltransferase n=1 Tax=Taibaiella helva TaxID=2301235 RepID=UPI000E575614|nr:GNAT family N-acetyltransferase [Taibaiella helva]
MENGVSTDTLAKWLRAWSLSRELPPPVQFRSGYKVDVGYAQQKARYVFATLNDDFIRLLKTINEPWVFLKVCAAPEEIEGLLPGRWVIQPQGYMMSCAAPMNIPGPILPYGYEATVDHYNATTLIKIRTKDGAPAATGRVVIVDDIAVYDRIATEEEHKRKGLAAFLMKMLEQVALSKNVHWNFLVATEQGKLLYLSLGWAVCSLYTSVVIPA